MLLILLLVSGLNGKTINDSYGEATFIVGWYDVGVDALEGQEGIISVEKGWHGSNEINRVFFDPEKIDVQQIEKLLKKSGTYLRTLQRDE